MDTRQFLILFFFCFCQFSFSSSISHLCSKDESISLLKFKKMSTLLNLSYYSHICDDEGQKSYAKMSSWNMSRDCCLWDGVICDEMTGHVIDLDLSCSRLVGIIDSNSSLFQLSHLQKLNLSYNNFSNSHISPEFGRFMSLTHLDLSYSYISGQIPSEISHLSKLQSLRLPTFFGGGPKLLRLAAHDFKLLLQNLTQLRELDLSGVNISSTIPPNISSCLTTLWLIDTSLYGIIPQNIFHQPNLESLRLEENDQLSGYFPKTKWNSSASLIELGLGGVNFSDNLPESLGYLTSLQYLALYSCNLWGEIPESLSNLTGIKHLIISNNSLNGTIPSWIFSQLPSLSTLDLGNNNFSGQLEDFKYNALVWIDLSDNQLQGHLPKSIKNLVNLTRLYLSYNNFSGHVDVSLFSDLKYLTRLDLSYNRISLTNENKVKSTLPESLKYLQLAACKVKELEFLSSAKQLLVLDLSYNKLQGRIPDWTWSSWKFSLINLNISHNMLTSVDSIPLQSVSIIDLRSNLLQGSIPILPDSIRVFFISNNKLSGEIPLSICNLTSLQILDLSSNNLRGEIPQCLGKISGLEVFDMHHNKLSGTLPTTFTIRTSLRSLNLHNNELEGKIPQCLANCKELQVLDLGDNHLNDTFPVWLGTLPKLQVLSLRSNKLHGSICTSRIKDMFPELRIIDLSYNAFSGNLPTSMFQRLKAMRIINQTMKAPTYLGDSYYHDSITVATKGLKLKLVRILSVYTTIDLSSNKFEGRIPSIVGELIALRVLNLSHNRLQGPIPSSLGSLSVVESFDLSFNQLSGEIPHQLASLTFLEFLNLSHNHLQGCIPQGPQFATFENNSYEGNNGLRGFPVSKGCGNDWVPETNNTGSALDDQESNSEFLKDFWKAALMGYGSGLCIGLSIVYFMISTGNLKWLERIIEELEHKIIMRRRKKQRGQRNYRRNDRF
ncbi:receptor-like protein Cf-9 [Lycium barbarum]|uniref:receptor-like protein Cf-9 n=1 Tax=Lycium barbarum TaxID=112863 RepID=UPI00293E6A39|nr:receptor-like protein Cf-9 [Lycium barbarum]